LEKERINKQKELLAIEEKIMKFNAEKHKLKQQKKAVKLKTQGKQPGCM